MIIYLPGIKAGFACAKYYDIPKGVLFWMPLFFYHTTNYLDFKEKKNHFVDILSNQT